MHSALSAQGSIMISKSWLEDKAAHFTVSVEITQKKAITLTKQLPYTGHSWS